MERKRKRPIKTSRVSTPDAFARRSPPQQSQRSSRNSADEGKPPERKFKRPSALKRTPAPRPIEPTPKAATGAAGQKSVADHYNCMPERGRAWRHAGSTIPGLRNFNNWVKSTLITKFAMPPWLMPDSGVFPPGTKLRVLDMACGKGGDLGKWEKSSTSLRVHVHYVGCDIAEVSIQQAQARYLEARNSRRHYQHMTVEFYHKDSFGKSLNDLPVIRTVGFDPHVGPNTRPVTALGNPGIGYGGFDVVSCMFALHYSFVDEDHARGMLANVAGSLRKGGRFIGTVPSSDFIRQKITGRKDPKGPWNPEVFSPDITDENGNLLPCFVKKRKTSDSPPEEEQHEEEEMEPISWGNSCYRVTYPPPMGPRQGSAETAKTENDPPKREEAAQADDPPKPKKRRLKLPLFRPPFGHAYHYYMPEAVDAIEYVVPWPAFRSLALQYGLDLQYQKDFLDIWKQEGGYRDLEILAERMGVVERKGRDRGERGGDRDRDRGDRERRDAEGKDAEGEDKAREAEERGLLVSDEELEAASFYKAFCFVRI
ncbi:mRNA capping enzyme, large subunit [Piedraia hortae CBS 480.64]|uniref:mRNA cap guanine-N(7) methyltransferase n=1 Tax=Piedraia hortae CBS 480.64 TaxID=1314780 RepID=A0A6A7BZ70_9PEZI|nr:mRNA capping enzyme, large subunit [Piedraia hortae CBS 480.64]